MADNVGTPSCGLLPDNAFGCILHQGDLNNLCHVRQVCRDWCRMFDEVVKGISIEGSYCGGHRAWRCLSFPALQYLACRNCDDCSFQHVCSWLSSSSQVTTMKVTLAVGGSCLTAPLATAVSHLPKLQHLIISKCCCSQMPSDIGHHHALKTLDFSHNHISELPASIGYLTSLQKLDVSDNRLSNLPESLFGLKQLTELVLSHNLLTDLNPAVSQLSNLSSLNMACNRLKGLPQSMQRMLHLKYLNLTMSFSHPIRHEISSPIGVLGHLLLNNSTLHLQMDESAMGFVKMRVRILK